MPTYEYQCTTCDHRFEVFQRITDDPVTSCARCGAPVRRLLFPVGIVFKGPGFHVNDYGKSGSSTSGGNSKKPFDQSSKDSESPAKHTDA